jgi:ketosteroid isomerase-like protein
MKRNLTRSLLHPASLALFLCSFGDLTAAAAEDPAHHELRMLRTNVLEAIKKQDIQAVLQNLHSNAVITWQNGAVNRGHQGTKEFFERMGKNAFRGYKVPPTPDDLTMLYGGDAGVVFGYSVGEYSLLGKSFEFTNRWTATVVKENDRWLLAGYHVSLNALDNPILNTAKNSLFVASGICLVIGLLVGLVIGRSAKRAAQSK